MGASGESWAWAWLRRQGYRVLDRNVKTPHGEVDLICTRNRTLHVVEVKTRKGSFEGDVSPAQARRLRNAALWLHGRLRPRRGSSERWGVRVDLVTVTFEARHWRPRIRLYPAIVEDIF